MKLNLCLIISTLSLATKATLGQGLVIYDQQSTNNIDASANIQSGQPLGQSFTPTFSSISFITLSLFDPDSAHDSGGSVFINLRSGSIGGPIIGVTSAVFIPNNFFGSTNFIFAIPVAITPGTAYILQPDVLPGSDAISLDATREVYAGGALIYQGVSGVGRNLWFQEGIIATPEPSTMALGLLGLACLLFAPKKQRKPTKTYT